MIDLVRLNLCLPDLLTTTPVLFSYDSGVIELEYVFGYFSRIRFVCLIVNPSNSSFNYVYVLREVSVVSLS